MITLQVLVSLFMMTVVAPVYIFSIAFIVWMVIDSGKQDKFWWLVFIIGIPFVGAVIYFFVEKKGDYAKISPAHREHKSE
jgi:hypothetical protein